MRDSTTLRLYDSTTRAGFSLVELIVVIGVFAIVGTVVLGFFLSTLTGRAKAQARAEAQEHARFAMERMVYEIRRARGIEGSSDFDVDLSETPSASLDLDMSTTGIDSTVISVASGIIYLKQGTDSAFALTSDDVDVTNLTFENHTTSSGLSEQIEMTLTVHHPDPTGQATTDVYYTLNTSVELRGE